MHRVGILVVLLAVAGGVVGCGGSSDSSCVGSSTDCTTVLFVGNSFTSMNDLPGTLVRLAAAGGKHVSVGRVLVDGQTLAGHVTSGDAAAALAKGGWDYVVLQEQSETPASSSGRRSMDAATATLAQQVRAWGATPLLFETWAHQNGLPDSGLPGFTAMQTALDAGYTEASSISGAAIVPVGDAWAAAYQADSTLGLWQPDGSHPSALGTQLAAAVFYRYLLHADPSAALTANCNCPATQAAEIAQVVAGSVPG